MKKFATALYLIMLWFVIQPAAAASSLNGIWSNSAGGYLVMLEQSTGSTVVILQVDPALSSGAVYVGSRSGNAVSAQGVAQPTTLALTLTDTRYSGTLATSGVATQALEGQQVFAYEGSANDGIWQRAAANDRYLALLTASINQASAVVILDVALGATPTYDVILGAMAGANIAGKSLLSGQGVTLTFAGSSPAQATYRVMSATLPPKLLESFDVAQIIVADTPQQPQAFSLASSSYAEGAAIPVKNACTGMGGSNVSPALSWSAPPTGTASYAIIMDDEIAPCGTGDNACIHWNAFNLPATATGLTEGGSPEALSASVVLGQAYNDAAGYQGPCPPTSHIYTTTVYALSKQLSFTATPSMTRSEFARTYAAHILGSTSLKGSFGE